MRTFLVTATAVVALALSGCSSDEGEPDFDVADAQVHSAALRVCSAAPPDQLAEDLRVLNFPTDIARAYSEDLPSEDQEVAFAGCLAGLAVGPGGG